MKDVVFIHGWSFDASLWNLLIPLLGDIKSHYIEMGFTGRPPQTDFPPDAIIIGHSLGVLWFLHHHTQQPKALISIAGFDCFSGHIPQREIKAMAVKLRRDPPALIENFQHRAGAANTPEALNLPKLEEGLLWLQEWNETARLQALKCPVLALAARDDKIVPAAMTQSIWNNYPLVWADTDSHILPLTHAAWCVDHIKKFIDAL